MRLSANQQSPHYHPVISRRGRVFVDGVELFCVLEADEEGGWVICALSNDCGAAVIDWRNHSLATYQLYGQVRIVCESSSLVGL